MRKQGFTTLPILLTVLLALTGCSSMREPSWPAAGKACTSFCLDNDGQAVLGTNYDNENWEGLLFVNKRGVTKTGWEPSTSGTYARWTSRYGSVTFNLAAIQMVWAGMNEAGLTVSTMWLGDTQNPPPDERPPLLSPLWLQLQLDTCATIQEVMANDEWVRVKDGVDHYLVCDRTGDCAVVEFLEGRTVFYAGGDLPLPVLTNAGYAKSVNLWQSGKLEGNALERFGIAAGRVSSYQPADAPKAVAHAFETLEQASGQATGGSPTQWSIVFDSENQHVHWTTSRSPQVRTVDLNRLDLSCNTPVQILDVHAPSSGDISTDLEPFSFATNLQQVKNFVEKWGGDISPLEIEVLEHGLATYPCTNAAVPSQGAIKPIIPPLAGWIALTAAYRLWPVGLLLAVAIIALVVRRVHAGHQTT